MSDFSAKFIEHLRAKLGPKMDPEIEALYREDEEDDEVIEDDDVPGFTDQDFITQLLKGGHRP